MLSLCLEGIYVSRLIYDYINIVKIEEKRKELSDLSLRFADVL